MTQQNPHINVGACLAITQFQAGRPTKAIGNVYKIIMFVEEIYATKTSSGHATSAESRHLLYNNFLY